MKETADDVVVPPLRVLALCAGGGGIELGLQLVLGREGVRTVGYCEREAYAAAVIVARMEDAALDHAPVWDDVGTFDGRRWRGAVDLVAAGFPCPPVSVAGKRKGDNDERWLWPDVFRVWQETGAPWLFVENVAGLRSSDIGDRSSVPVLGGIPDEWAGASERALQLILRDLAAGGYSAEWISLSAEQLGAPHQRDRVFLLAHADERGGHKDGAGGHPAIAGGRPDNGSQSGERLEATAKMWPTPPAGDVAGGRTTKGKARQGETGLRKVAQKWPTPKQKTGGPEGRASRARRGAGGEDLDASARMWGTPRAAEWKGAGPVGSSSHQHWLDHKYLTAQATLFRCGPPDETSTTPGETSSPSGT